MYLDNDEIERYSRQILFAGKQAQLSLKKARVIVLGAGGIGNGLIPYLVSSGVGYIRIIEPDIVEKSNLSRQILYNDDDVGLLKGAVARNKAMSMNPHLEIDWFADYFSDSNYKKYIQDIDLILEGTDSIENKFLVNDVALESGIPAIIGGLGASQGHIFPVAKNSKFSCYRCVFEKPPEGPIPTCATDGILSPLAGVIGATMAYYTVQFFLKNQLTSGIQLLEETRWRTIYPERQSNCMCHNYT